MVLTTCALLSYTKTQRQCLLQKRFTPGSLPSHDAWLAMLNNALQCKKRAERGDGGE